MSKKTVRVLRGIPGSGKTTWALQYIASKPQGTVVRINNDEIVSMAYGNSSSRQTDISNLLVKVRAALLETFLAAPAIDEILIDNTNLVISTVASLQKIAHRFNADFIVDDQFRFIDVDECIRRDSSRECPVGENVIRKMYRQSIKLEPWTTHVDGDVKIARYDNDDNSLPECYIFDIDGTLALAGSRSPYDWSNVHLDTPNHPVVTLLHLIEEAERYDIIFMSGRDSACRSETSEWIFEQLGMSGIPLFMRAAGDRRPDYIVKNELFQRHVAGKYRVAGVFDDRDQVVALWRNKLGLPTFQVADGAF